MASTKIIYTPKQSSIELEIPDGYELAEPEPREVKEGEEFLGWAYGDFDHPLTIMTMNSKTGTSFNHPLIGTKRFIVRKIVPPFIPKVGESVYVSNDTDTWCARVYIGFKDNHHICVMEHSVIESQLVRNLTYTSDYTLHCLAWKHIRKIEN